MRFRGRLEPKCEECSAPIERGKKRYCAMCRLERDRKSNREAQARQRALMKRPVLPDWHGDWDNL